VIGHLLEARRVEEAEAGQLGGPEVEPHLVAFEARDLVQRHHDLPAIEHALLHDDRRDLPRLRMQDQAADRPDTLSLAIADVGPRRN